MVGKLIAKRGLTIRSTGHFAAVLVWASFYSRPNPACRKMPVSSNVSRCEDPMFEDLRRERDVRRALRAIARQRVALVLQPGNFPVVECSPPDEEWFDVGVRTCHIRGWVEVLYEGMPTGALRMEGSSPVFPAQMSPKTHYRLTEGGWTVLNRSHGWVIATFTVALMSLVAGVASVALALLGSAK